MIRLSPEGVATTIAALLVIAVFMAAHAKYARRTRILAKYRRGEQDREVRTLQADVLEQINVDARRFG